MKFIGIQEFVGVVRKALVATLLVSLVTLSVYFVMEPLSTRGASDVFTVSQSITGEISFNASTTDVTMSPAIPGLTGGISNGSTEVVITTNNSTGYNMTIQFSSSTAMYRNGGGGEIENYVATSTADLTFDSTQIYGQFGYSVYSTTDAGDIDPTFLDDNSSCGTGSNSTAGNCWLAPSSTAAETIVNRTTATSAGGATTTIQFRIDIPNSPSPAIPTGTYTATATLTAVTN